MSRKRALILLGIATVVLDVALLVLDRRMLDTGGPGIIGLEFAGSKVHAAQIFAEWGSRGRDAARLSLRIDFAFMLSYGAFFTLAGLATRDKARRCGWRYLATAGIVVPWCAAAAAAFDACENVNLLLALDGRGGDLAPLVATVCASIKFALIAVAISYVVLGVIWRIGRRVRTGEQLRA
jgi:hypothetical protein